MPLLELLTIGDSLVMKIMNSPGIVFFLEIEGLLTAGTFPTNSPTVFGMFFSIEKTHKLCLMFRGLKAYMCGVQNNCDISLYWLVNLGSII